MRILLIITILSFITCCMSQKQHMSNHTPRISPDSAATYISIILLNPDNESLKKKKNIWIKFLIKNKTNDAIYINDPKYYINTIPLLYKGRERIYKTVRIKVSIQRLKERIKLEAHEEKEIVLHLTIDFLYNYLLTEGDYTLLLEYNGGIFDANRKEITPVAGIRSNEVKFSIE